MIYEISRIKRRQNEGLHTFMDRFKSESSHIKGVPLVLRISAFMHGHGHPELAKKLNDKIRKTVNKMFERVRAFIRGEVAARSAEMNKTPEEREHRKNNIRSINMIREGGNRKRPFEEERILLTVGVIKDHVEHCLKAYNVNIQLRLEDAEFLMEGQGMRSIGAVGSTIHSMIKFPTNQGIVTMETSREDLWECRHLERVQGSWTEVQWHQREEKMSRIREQVILRTNSSYGRRPNSGSTLPDFASVFQFNNRVLALEKDVSELKKDDPLKTQVIALVNEHLDAILGATGDENYLLASITARITEQIKNQLP
ncbi:hypothetical protein Tco_0072220 [Tanacetum coccineum]